MSHHHHTDYVEVVSKKGPGLNGVPKVLLIVLTVLGFAAFAGALVMDARTAWISYLHNFYFFTGLAAGGLVVAVIIQVARAMWGRPIKRFGESFGAFLPVSIVLAIPLLLFGMEHLYEWAEWPRLAAENPAAWESVKSSYANKVTWLTSSFVSGRVIFSLVVLTLLGWKFMSISARADLGVAHEVAPDKWTQPAGWKGRDEEVAAAQAAMSKWGVFYCFAFAFLISMLAYDLIMSLDYRWFSTMFGGWNFTSFILISWGSMYLFTAYFSSKNGIGHYYHKLIYHDLGKLTFGFTVVWGYLFFAQLMVIWYGNLSHETGWLITRIHHEDWKNYCWLAAGMVFVLPFIMGLGKVRKMSPRAYSWVIIVSISGVWLERFCLIAPAAWTFDRHKLEYADGIGRMLAFDVAIALGFLGLFGLVVTNYLSKKPLMVVSDPRLDEGINRH